MKIKEIMVENVITVNQDTSISEVAKMLHQYKIHGIPVVREKHLIGIITETDFFTKNNNEIYLPSYINFLNSIGKQSGNENKTGFEEILGATAKDIMTENCIVLNPEDEVAKLIELIKEKNLHTVPVAIGDLLVGIVTIADLIKLMK